MLWRGLVRGVKWIGNFWLRNTFVRCLGFWISCSLIVLILGLLVFPNFGRFFQDKRIMQPEGDKIQLFLFLENHMNHVSDITLSCYWGYVYYGILKLDCIVCLWTGWYLHFEFEKFEVLGCAHTKEIGLKKWIFYSVKRHLLETSSLIPDMEKAHYVH